MSRGRLLEPILHITLLSVVFSLMMEGRPPIGAHFFIFYFTGLIPYLMFVHTSSAMSHAITNNGALLQLPSITTFDVDWNGDGTFEQSGIAATNDTATVSHTFTSDGHYIVIVRAHNSDGSATYTDVYDAQQVDITPDNCPPYGYVTHSPDLPQSGQVT